MKEFVMNEMQNLNVEQTNGAEDKLTMIMEMTIFAIFVVTKKSSKRQKIFPRAKRQKKRTSDATR